MSQKQFQVEEICLLFEIQATYLEGNQSTIMLVEGTNPPLC